MARIISFSSFKLFDFSRPAVWKRSTRGLFRIVQIEKIISRDWLVRNDKIGALYFGALRLPQLHEKTKITHATHFARLLFLAAMAAHPVHVFWPVLMPP